MGKKYCSGSCRAKASVINRALGILPAPAPSSVSNRTYSQPSHNNVDQQSQYIISHLTKESERWENLYNTEKADRKKLKEKNEELEKKILSIENEHRISALENAKPSGLNGILSTPAGEKLIEMCAPLIQRMMEPQPAPQIAGTDGAQQTPAQLFQHWFSGLTMPTQQTVWKMLQSFTIMPDDKLKEYAASVIEQISYTYPNQAASK